jgi:30S ribosomal protein S31
MLKDTTMGKGDKKSKRGKIANKSYGARRPRKIKKKPTVEEKISIKNKT